MKLRLSFLLTFLTSFLFAQNPTYEQTVDFIETNVVGRMLYEGALDSYQRETGHKLTKIEIQKDGRIKLVADQQHGRHDFEIVFNIFDLKSSIDYPDGIRAYKFLVHFQGLNVSKGYGITFATDADAKRVARAFRHLKTMCSKGGGLFDSPTQKERPTLTKNETLEYIDNLLIKHSKLSYNQYGGTTSLTQHFNSRTGSFNIRESVSGNGPTGWTYDESEKDYSNLTHVPIENVSISDPNSAKKGFNRKFHSVKLNYSLPIQYTYKYRRNYVYNDQEYATESEARRNCKSQSWTSRNKTNKSVEIFIDNESSAKRLKNAFEHLADLLKEEKKSEIENDPFGN